MPLMTLLRMINKFTSNFWKNSMRERNNFKELMLFLNKYLVNYIKTTQKILYTQNGIEQV